MKLAYPPYHHDERLWYGNLYSWIQFAQAIHIYAFQFITMLPTRTPEIRAIIAQYYFWTTSSRDESR